MIELTPEWKSYMIGLASGMILMKAYVFYLMHKYNRGKP